MRDGKAGSSKSSPEDRSITEPRSRRGTATARTSRLVGLTTAVLLAVTPIASAEPAAAADDMLSPASRKGLELTKHSKRYRDQVEKLDKKLDTTSIGSVVENAPHAVKSTRRGFDWTGGEQKGETWVPQGITGSSDAHPGSGKYGKHRIIATSWYDNEGKKDCWFWCDPTKRGVRVSFVNYDNPDKPRFAHVQLVVPDGNGSIRPLVHTKDGEQESLHAGGIAWVGDYLYVADTHGGIRQFDVRNVWKGEPDEDHVQFGVHGNKVKAADYRYAIPQVGMYRSTGSKKPTFSSVSVDHTKGHRALVTGEYKEDAKGGRIVRWPLRGNQPATDDKQVVRPRKKDHNVFKVKDRQMQGAVSYENTFFTSHSNKNERGHWRRMREHWKTGGHGDMPKKPEDVSYNPASDRAWWLTEQAGQRHVRYTPKAMG